MKNKLWIVFVFMLIPLVGLGRDPFLPLTQKKSIKQSDHLTWITLRFSKAEEIVQWLSHQKGLIQKPIRFGTDMSGRRIWIFSDAVGASKLLEIIREMDLPKKQILVKARFVRINSDYENKLGFKWKIDHQKPSGAHHGLHLGLPEIDVSPGNVHVQVACLDDAHVLDMELNALESSGAGKIIASPKLLVSENKEASIESGEKIPYQEKVNHDSTAIHFEKAVLGLSVTAHSLPDNKIAMDLIIHQDKPTGIISELAPAINTHVIKTHVVVSSGQVIVLGGIYEDAVSTSVQKVPLLGDIPVLGVMFRHREKHCARTELMVYVQPSLVE